MIRPFATATSPRTPRSSAPELDTGWTPGPSRPTLERGTVHVWRASLQRASDAPLDTLSRHEWDRAARFRHDRDGLLWARSRGVLRALLGRYLALAPGAVELALEQNGKPALGGAAAACVSFNLSHSGALALYAFSRSSPVGVDVQVARGREIHEPAIARRAFGAAEAARLAGLDGEQREREFLRAWTRHEALLKCRGEGIWSPPGAHRERRDGPPPWSIQLDPGEGAEGALAAERRPLALQRLEWRG
jgi:4'-phosphopantetheinyl transferase